MGGDGGGRQRRGRLRLRLQLLAALSAQPHAAPPFPPPSNPKFCFTCTFPFILFYFFYPPPLLPTPPTTPPPRAASQPPLPPLPHPSLFLPSSSHRSAPGGAGDDVTTRGATTNPSVPPAGGSWTAIKPSLQKHSDASSVREMLRAASPPPDLGMGEVGGVSLHWVNELPFSSIPHYGIKDMERTKTKAQQRSEEEEGQEEKAGAPRASDTSRGGERGVVAAPMSPCRGSDIAFQPRCSRREARAAAPGKYRALLGLQPRPRPPPLPHHPPPPPPPPSAQRIPSAGTDCGTVRTAQHRDPPRNISAPVPRTSPSLPPPASRRADVPRPYPRQPRGGGRLNGPGGS